MNYQDLESEVWRGGKACDLAQAARWRLRPKPMLHATPGGRCARYSCATGRRRYSKADASLIVTTNGDPMLNVPRSYGFQRELSWLNLPPEFLLHFGTVAA